MGIKLGLLQTLSLRVAGKDQWRKFIIKVLSRRRESTLGMRLAAHEKDLVLNCHGDYNSDSKRKQSLPSLNNFIFAGLHGKELAV